MYTTLASLASACPTVYDASLEKAGWDSDSELDYAADGDWTTATELTAAEDAPIGPMVSATALFDPIRVTARTPAVSVTRVVVPQQLDGEGSEEVIFVVDFGANRAGVVEVALPPSDEALNVTIVHGEILAHELLPTNATDEWGPSDIDPRRVYVGNLRSAVAADSYARPAMGTANGATTTTWIPRMTYDGFRYVEVQGWPSSSSSSRPPRPRRPALSDLHQLHQRSDLPQRTAVALPNQPVLETAFNLSLGAQRSNLMSVATDCPQRDERLAWTGDLALSADSMALNFDGFQGFARSTLEALRLSQNASSDPTMAGDVPDVVPFVRYGARPGDVSWSAVLPSLLWALYEQYGDLDTAAEYFDDAAALQRLIASSAFDSSAPSSSPDLSSLAAGYSEYGDWCPPPRCAVRTTGRAPSRAWASRAPSAS